MKINKIKWVTDGEDVKLPDSVILKDVVDEEDVADYLSDNYGFLVESFSVYRGKNWTIREIEAIKEKEAKRLAIERDVIKGHDIYYVDLGEYFGYSCLVFKDGHHVYYANLYQLHYRSFDTTEDLKAFYTKKLCEALFTEEDLGMPLSDHDEYRRREYFLRNYYIMRVDYLSCFGIGETKEEISTYNRKKARMHYDPVSFAYVKDTAFVKKHVKLFSQLLDAKKSTVSDYEYQKKAFLTEMYNHEYGINWEADFDTLSAFGNLEYVRDENELDSYFDQLGFNDVQKRAYIDARSQYYSEAYV